MSKPDLEAIRKRNLYARELLAAVNTPEIIAEQSAALAEGFPSHTLHCPAVGVATFDQLMDDIPSLLAEVDRLRAALERVEKLAGEVANDLEAELNARYHGPDDVHPAMQVKYDRDVAPIRELRAALSTGRET